MEPVDTDEDGEVEVPYPVPRRTHTKSKLGCRNCKQRRVKCDEQRPVCGNCAVHYKNMRCCEYDKYPRRRRAPAAGATPSAMTRQPTTTKNSSDESLPTPPESNALTPFAGPRDLAPGAIDPFTTHVATGEPNKDRLLSVYFNAQIFNIFPYYPTRDLNPFLEFYAPLIWKDDLLLHVTLLLGAAYLERHTPQPKSHSVRLRSKCLQLLQERVEQPLSESISDATMSAVAGLATLEHEQGNPRLSEMHMDGLQRMLNLRGGIGATRESNPAVAHMLFCLYVAAANGNFPAQDLSRPVARPAWVFKALDEETEEARIDFEAHGVARPYAALMINIRMLAKTFQTAQDCTSAAEYQGVLDFLCATLQRLLELPLPCLPKETFSYENCATAACRHAMVSHVFAQWCTSTPDPSLVVHAAQQGLLQALRPILLNRISNKLVLWLVCVGASGVKGQAERKWFVGQLASVVDDLHIDSWDELCASLQQVIWHNHQDEGCHRQLWADIKARKEAQASLVNS